MSIVVRSRSPPWWRGLSGEMIAIAQSWDLYVESTDPWVLTGPRVEHGCAERLVGWEGAWGQRKQRVLVVIVSDEAPSHWQQEPLIYLQRPQHIIWESSNPRGEAHSTVLLVSFLEYTSLTYMGECCCSQADWLEKSRNLEILEFSMTRAVGALLIEGWEIVKSWASESGWPGSTPGSAISLLGDLGDSISLKTKTEAGTSTLQQCSEDWHVCM